MKKDRRKFRNILLGSFLFILAAGFNSCKKDDEMTTTPPVQLANEVWMQNTAFSPATLTVAMNTTVRWTNKDGMNHTVTSDNSLFDSGNITDGGTFSYTFTTIGSFKYHCTLHNGMTGTVVVVDHL